MPLPHRRLLIGCCLAGLLALPLWADPAAPDKSSRRDRQGNVLPPGALARVGTERAGPGGAVLAVAFTPDSRELASAGMDAAVHLWDRVTGREVRRLEEKPHIVYAVAFSPDGKTLASARHDGVISLWDMHSGERRREMQGHQGYVKALAFSPDGKTLASGGVDETIRFWDTASGRQVKRLDPDQGWIEALAFSPDGRVIACGTPYETIRLWEVSTGRETGRLARKGDGTLCLAFSPDGRTLAAAGKTTTIRLLELATGKVRGKLAGHFDCVSSLAFAPDGRTLVSGSADRTVRLWDLASTEELCRWEGHRDAVYAIALSRDGSALASASKDATALLWDLSESARSGRSALQAPSAEEVEELWQTLAGDDAAAAYKAVWRLASAPEQAVAFVRRQIRPPEVRDRERVARLIADLDNDDFEVRQKASAELAKLGRDAEAALREVFTGSPSAEVRKRVEALLEKRNTPEASASRRRWLRALEVLEAIGGDEARGVVGALARGTAEAPSVTVEARATLERMAKRPAPP